MSDSILVYSTESGRIQAEKVQAEAPKGDGSGVCVISGLELNDDELKKLAAELKKRCGCGGSVKNGFIEIQGEKRELLKQLLEQKGFRVKLAGG